MRVEITFKKKEQEIYEFLKKNSKYISTSGYIKSLIAKEMEKENKDKK